MFNSESLIIRIFFQQLVSFILHNMQYPYLFVRAHFLKGSRDHLSQLEAIKELRLERNIFME